MIVWINRQKHRPIETQVIPLVAGVGEAPCPECEGTGWWAYAEPEEPGGPCVDCKGTGVMKVMFWPRPPAVLSP